MSSPNRWTGNLGSGTVRVQGLQPQSSRAERRGEEQRRLRAHSDPAFRGDPSRYNPEELLVGALSACHMLALLHLCVDAGIVVTDYSDEAEGEMIEHPDGSGEFTRVILHPRMTITDPARIPDAIALNHRAHELCFIARSVNFPVEHEPAVTAG